MPVGKMADTCQTKIWRLFSATSAVSAKPPTHLRRTSENVGIDMENADEIYAKLPIPAKAKIVQLEGVNYKRIIWEDSVLEPSFISRWRMNGGRRSVYADETRFECFVRVNAPPSPVHPLVQSLDATASRSGCGTCSVSIAA